MARSRLRLLIFTVLLAMLGLALLTGREAAAQPVPVPGVNLTYICQVPVPGGGEAPIFRIDNNQDVPGLTVTTTRSVGPQGAPVPAGQSYFRGANGTTVVRFNAPGFADRSIPKASGVLQCRSNLTLNKVVEGDGPAGPYTVEVREGATVVRTVEVTAPNPTEITLPAGFVTNDYPGFGSQTRIDYSVEEVGTRGADSVTYDPGRQVSLVRGSPQTVTITNTFDPDPVPGVNLTSICQLREEEGGDAIWRISNPENVPGLTFTTTLGTGPDGATALPGNSTFRGSDVTTRVRFSAPGFADVTVVKAANNIRCEGTLNVDKQVLGDGPAGPYEFEVREGDSVVRTANVTAPDPTSVTLPTGFETNDYPGFTSQARGPFTVVETNRRGADEVTYAPGQEFSLANGDTSRVTITNTFNPDPITGVDLRYVCSLNGNAAIWRVTNSDNISNLTFTTTQGAGPDGVNVLPGNSTFRGSNSATTVRFMARGFIPATVERPPGDRACEGTLTLDKVVQGPGPDGPYTVAVRSQGQPERRVGINATGATTVTLPAGFVTDDYTGFESRARDYTIVEVETRGARLVRYRPQDFSLVDRQSVDATVINIFGRLCADLSVKVKAPNRVTVGNNFKYTVTAKNSGPADVNNAVLTSRLPNSVKFVRAPDGCRYDRAANKVTCNLGDVAAGTQKQREITVKAEKAGTVRLQGCAVKSGTPDCNPSNNQLGSAGARSAGGDPPQPVPGVGPETQIVEAQEGSS